MMLHCIELIRKGKVIKLVDIEVPNVWGHVNVVSVMSGLQVKGRKS